MICSAGNDNLNTDIDYHYPSGYGDRRLFPEIDNVISVGSISRNGTRSYFSNYGENSVNIYAPGEDIYSTLPNDKYGNKSGTSMAAPFVTGTAALLLSHDHNLTASEIKNIIFDSANELNIEGVKAKVLNAGNALNNYFNPNRLVLKNKGYVSDNGGGWNIQVTNNNNSQIKVIYNSKMCYGGDAQNWTGLTDIVYFDLAAGSSKTAFVASNYSATHVAFSFISGGTRYITYANELIDNTKWLTPHSSAVAHQSYSKNNMGVSIIGKNGDKWIIELTNNTGVSRDFYYNSKMCYAGDAQNWTGLSDITKTGTISNKGSTIFQIGGNASATSIAISYISGNTRYIFYANELNNNKCTMTSYASTKSYRSYSQNGITVSIAGKNGNTWLIELTNNTGASRTFDYNEKLCYAGDAEKWTNLSDVKSISLADGQTTSTPLKITENYSATSIAISYMEGVNRKILYANNLNVDGTMSSFSSTIDTTAPPESGCITSGTMITLADGTQKAVENLSGNEMLLVWNMETGTFDSAPIVFVDFDQTGHYDVIELVFSDGTFVDVISEHAFWDIDLNKYVYLDENADDYIGHRFRKSIYDADSGYQWKEVELCNVTIDTKIIEAYSPVTYQHLCYFVNGMLSMPGGISGLINIFDVDPATFTIDKNAKEADISQYGLFTYEEFYEMFPVPKTIFNAFNGQYLKIAIQKGYITYQQIGNLINRYAEFF